MKIKYSPQYMGRKINYIQSAKDVLEIIDEENGNTGFDFSDKTIVEFNVSELSFCNSAKRIDGVLHLELLQGYSANEKDIWEDEYYCESGFRGMEFEEFGTKEQLI